MKFQGLCIISFLLSYFSPNSLSACLYLVELFSECLCSFILSDAISFFLNEFFHFLSLSSVNSSFKIYVILWFGLYSPSNLYVQCFPTLPTFLPHCNSLFFFLTRFTYPTPNLLAWWHLHFLLSPPFPSVPFTLLPFLHLFPLIFPPLLSFSSFSYSSKYREGDRGDKGEQINTWPCPLHFPTVEMVKWKW